MNIERDNEENERTGVLPSFNEAYNRSELADITNKRPASPSQLPRPKRYLDEIMSEIGSMAEYPAISQQSEQLLSHLEQQLQYDIVDPEQAVNLSQELVTQQPSTSLQAAERHATNQPWWTGTAAAKTTETAQQKAQQKADKAKKALKKKKTVAKRRAASAVQQVINELVLAGAKVNIVAPVKLKDLPKKSAVSLFGMITAALIERHIAQDRPAEATSSSELRVQPGRNCKALLPMPQPSKQDKERRLAVFRLLRRIQLLDQMSRIQYEV
jgi:hypothetical protein